MHDPNVRPIDHFLFVGCRLDSHRACKREILNRYPEMRFAFSRAGFMTFKLDPSAEWPLAFDLKSTFARTYGWTITKSKSTSLDNLSREVLDFLSSSADYRAIHVWGRRQQVESKPYRSECCDEAVEAVGKKLNSAGLQHVPVNRIAGSGARVLDVVTIDPDSWWFGFHFAGTVFQRWPGGFPLLHENPDAINRAYYKTSEALMWSGLPIQPGDTCVEIGSAPGGSCQRLLETGAKVIAIDPAELDERIAGHPNLRQLKMRGRDVRHQELRDAKWLLVDSNVAPRHTLDTVHGLVTGKKTKFYGLLLTLKLLDWKLADEIPLFIEEVRTWGFQYVKTRQLAWGGQEVCLMALKRKSVRRIGR